MFKASKTCCALDSLQLEFIESNYRQAIPLKGRDAYKLGTQIEMLTNFLRI